MSSVATDPFNEVISRLDEVSGRGDERTARCPAHDDNRPSLSVARGDEHPVVFNCFAGCTTEEIVSALGLDWSDVCEGDLGEERKQFEKAPWEHGRHVETYPYHDEEGNELYNVKRYEHPEHGWKSFRPYLPGKRRAGLGKQERVLYRLPIVKPHAKDGGVVFILEGEEDVHTLEDQDFHATTAGSADSWQDRFAQQLAGGKIVVVPDNDEAGEELARNAAKSCFPVADWVRVIRLEDVPDGGDVTDWFARGHTKEELSELVHETGDWNPDMAPSANGQAEKHSDHNVSGDSDPWTKIRTVYEDDKKQARLFAAKQTASDLHVATDRASGQCYVWDEEDKVLDPGGEQRIGELLLQKLGAKHSRHEQKEITEKVRLLTAQDEFGGEYVPVANGDLFLNSGSVRLENADPQRAPLTRSDAAWDPDAECQCFMGHLKGVMPSEQERETLQEYAGYCLLHWDIPLHKALFMVGPTASGKSTTLTAIRKLMGRVSKLSPQQLVNGRFGPAELEGAWANVRSDISSAVLQDIGLFKEVVAGDPIYVERKYEQGYNIRPTAKHMYSANQLPEASIDDDAFYRRILLVSFPTTIPKDERVNRSELDARLEQELDGILRWAVQGLQRVMDQNGFTHDLGPDETRRRWESRASSIGRFKATALNITGDHSEDFIPKEKAYSAYTQFCNDRGLAKEEKPTLTRTLKQDSRISDAQRTPPGYSKQVRCYTGFQLDEQAL
jgi:putative DNA primase/helicase